MNVHELISELMKVENKNLEVFGRDFNDFNGRNFTINEVSEGYNDCVILDLF